MELNWSNLPSQNLQEIFKYLENIELRPLTLVCKHWNTEVDFYSKDKVWLRVDRFIHREEFELLTQSQRHFECIKIVHLPNDSLEDVLKVLMILTGRKLRFPNEVVEARIHYKDYNFLMPILCEIGESLKNLHLVAADDNWYYGRMKDNVKFKKLSSVEVLRIDGLSNNIKHIAKKFSGLKVLKLSSNSKSRKCETINIVDTFLKGNPNLEKLYIKGLFNAEYPDDIFAKSPKLQILKALTPSCGDVIMKSKLNLKTLHIGKDNILEPEVIRANYPLVENLKLENCSNIEPLWSLEHLRSLALSNIDLTKDVVLFPKPILTTLELEKVRNEPFIIQCIKNTPNIENCIIRGSFFVFQEIASHWKHLKTFKYLWKRRRDFEFRTEFQFKCLESFSSNIDLSMLSIVNFFENFKAPKLKYLNFNSDLFYLTKDARGEKWNEILPNISKNHPLIEILTLNFNLGFKIDNLRFICKEMKKLKTLILEHSVPDEQESIPDALMLSKSLNSVQIMNLLNHKIKEKLRSITDPPLRLVLDPQTTYRYNPPSDEYIYQGDNLIVRLGKTHQEKIQRLSDFETEFFHFEEYEIN